MRHRQNDISWLLIQNKPFTVDTHFTYVNAISDYLSSLSLGIECVSSPSIILLMHSGLWSGSGIPGVCLVRIKYALTQRAWEEEMDTWCLGTDKSGDCEGDESLWILRCVCRSHLLFFLSFSFFYKGCKVCFQKLLLLIWINVPPLPVNGCSGHWCIHPNAEHDRHHPL